MGCAVFRPDLQGSYVAPTGTMSLTPPNYISCVLYTSLALWPGLMGGSVYTDRLGGTALKFCGIIIDVAKKGRLVEITEKSYGSVPNNPRWGQETPVLHPLC